MAVSAKTVGMTPPTQASQIHDRLREMILSLELSPGEKLSERWLETQFNGSRTPIRAALLRLQSEDLVQRDGRGWTVAPIDTDEISALAEYREPIEMAIVRLVCARASDADLLALSELLDSGHPDIPREAWHRLGTDFHEELARLSGNAFMLKSIRGVMTRLSRVRWLEVLTAQRRQQSWQEHRHILDLIRARDADTAAQAAAQHIRDTRDRLLWSLTNERQYIVARGMTVVGGREHV